MLQIAKEFAKTSIAHVIATEISAGLFLGGNPSAVLSADTHMPVACGNFLFAFRSAGFCLLS
jgi:hypothetical protein